MAKLLQAVRFDSVRGKILAFAVLATLVPSLATTWLSYNQNKRSLTQRISEELRTVGTQTAREMDVWIKERLYDLRVFASSYEVSGNLVRGGPEAHRRLTNYLNSVRDRFAVYRSLVVVEPQGRPVVGSGGNPGALRLPAGWQKAMRAQEPAVGPPYWDDGARLPVMMLAVPIRHASGRLVGALTAQVDLRTLEDDLRRFAPRDSGRLFLLTSTGQGIIGAQGSSAELMRLGLPGAEVQQAAGEPLAREYRSIDGRAVIGVLRRAPRLGWVVAAEIPSAEAYHQVVGLRNVALLLVAALLAGVGLIAYLLGLVIVRPLDRLTEGAAKVAAGDFGVKIPVLAGGELAYLTEAFNDMVARLRAGRAELERLSATDALTGLYNRRHLTETVAAEVRRAARLKHRFALLMADIDEFKRYNDTFGHLAGDEVLARVAKSLRRATRDVDIVARYGGEEFLVLLPETRVDDAMEIAQRVRAEVAKEAFVGGHVTLSIGVAGFPEHGDNPEVVIAAADAALYQAKGDGRNRVARAPRQRRARETKRKT